MRGLVQLWPPQSTMIDALLVELVAGLIDTTVELMGTMVLLIDTADASTDSVYVGAQ